MCVNSFRMFIYLFSISSEGYHFSVPFVIFLVCFCLFLFVLKLKVVNGQRALKHKEGNALTKGSGNIIPNIKLNKSFRFKTGLLKLINYQTNISWPHHNSLSSKRLSQNQICHFEFGVTSFNWVYKPYHTVYRSISIINKQQYFPKPKGITHPKESGWGQFEMGSQLVVGGWQERNLPHCGSESESETVKYYFKRSFSCDHQRVWEEPGFKREE